MRSFRSLASGCGAALIVALCFTLFVSAASAAPVPYTVDLAHTRVMFTVSHLGFSVQPGIFHDVDVRFAFDEARPENSTLEVRIRAASVDMFVDKLNEHLRAKEFFAADTFPDIKFHSTKVTMHGADKATVTGDFTLLGVTKPTSFEVTLNKAGPHPMRKDINALGFGATGVIDRTTFGMNAFAPLVGKDIAFTISLEANNAPEK